MQRACSGVPGSACTGMDRHPPVPILARFIFDRGIEHRVKSIHDMFIGSPRDCGFPWRAELDLAPGRPAIGIIACVPYNHGYRTSYPFRTIDSLGRWIHTYTCIPPGSLTFLRLHVLARRKRSPLTRPDRHAMGQGRLWLIADVADAPGPACSQILGVTSSAVPGISRTSDETSLILGLRYTRRC